MSTEPDPEQMDRDALIAEVVLLRERRDILRRALLNVDSIGGAVVDTALSLEHTLGSISSLLRHTDPAAPTQEPPTLGLIESALLSTDPVGVVYTREPDGSNQQ
ncbi:hypothetical protein SEA_MAGICMAN_64 [Gordonia phage MagicMan]|nr:hypothetical protein SEA_MAGICMAN_64 [Gordonia phage MagicMan]